MRPRAFAQPSWEGIIVKNIVGRAVALFVLAQAGSSAGADAGLVAQWHLDEGSGTTAVDSSGHGNNGTVLAGASWVAGRFGAALSFDGSTGRVRVGNSPSLEPSSAVSVGAWVNHAGSPGDYKYVLAKGAAGCIAASYAIYSGPNGGLEFYVSKNGGSIYARSPDARALVWDGNWHFVVGTFDGSNIRLFVDGNEVGSGTSDSGRLEYLLPDSNELFIGDYPGCGMRNFSGAIDEVSVWSRALTAAEVNATMAPPGGSPSAAPGQIPPSAGQPEPKMGGQPAGQRGQLSNPPALGTLRVSPSAFAVAFGRRRIRGNRPIGATISYSDTQAARSTFTVLLASSGVTKRRRCVKPPRRNRGNQAGRCTRDVALGSVTHADSAGRNRLHFAGFRGRKLAPGRYLLDATPSANGRTGATVSIAFTIIP
jgi:hypothetical protein